MLIKESVTAVGQLYRHNLIARKNDILDNEINHIDPELLSYAREFRKHMIKFKDATRQLR